MGGNCVVGGGGLSSGDSICVCFLQEYLDFFLQFWGWGLEGGNGVKGTFQMAGV